MFSKKKVIIKGNKKEVIEIISKDDVDNNALVEISISKAKYKFSKVDTKAIMKIKENFEEIQGKIFDIDEIVGLEVINLEDSKQLLVAEKENFSIYSIENEIHVSFIK